MSIFTGSQYLPTQASKSLFLTYNYITQQYLTIKLIRCLTMCGLSYFECKITFYLTPNLMFRSTFSYQEIFWVCIYIFVVTKFRVSLNIWTAPRCIFIFKVGVLILCVFCTQSFGLHLDSMNTLYFANPSVTLKYHKRPTRLVTPVLVHHIVGTGPLVSMMSLP